MASNRHRPSRLSRLGHRNDHTPITPLPQGLVIGPIARNKIAKEKPNVVPINPDP